MSYGTTKSRAGAAPWVARAGGSNTLGCPKHYGFVYWGGSAATIKFVLWLMVKLHLGAEERRVKIRVISFLSSAVPRNVGEGGSATGLATLPTANPRSSERHLSFRCSCAPLAFPFGGIPVSGPDVVTQDVLASWGAAAAPLVLTFQELSRRAAVPFSFYTSGRRRDP